jgi:thiol-disulfide isomerase/thioredoxin
MRPWFTLGAAIMAAGLGYWAWHTQQPATAPEHSGTGEAPPPPPLVTQPEQLQQLPDLSYTDLAGQERKIREWQGKVVVLNFWATWCPPCREETPLFVALQEEYGARGVQFVGLAIDEQEAVQNFVDTYGVEYPILLGDMDAVELSRRLGNRLGGLPYTVVIARDGQIAARHVGGLKREQLEPLLVELAGRPEAG